MLLSMDEMGNRIKALRLAHGMTQLDLAKACGVTKSAVSGWETGATANIKLQTFLKVCQTLHTTPQFLIFGPDRAQNRQSGLG